MRSVRYVHTRSHRRSAPSSSTHGRHPRPCMPPRPGRRVKRVNGSTGAAQGAKARSPRGAALMGSAARGIGVSRKRTCSTSRPPRPSISTVLSRGWTSAPGRRRAPPVSPPSPQCSCSIPVRQQPESLVKSPLPLYPASLTESHPLCLFYTTEIFGLDHGVGHLVSMTAP